MFCKFPSCSWAINSPNNKIQGQNVKNKLLLFSNFYAFQLESAVLLYIQIRRFHTRILSLSFSLLHITHSLTLTHIHLHTHTQTYNTLSHTHTDSLTHSLTHTLAYTISSSLSHSLLQTHTHTHMCTYYTHCLSLTLSRSTHFYANVINLIAIVPQSFAPFLFSVSNENFIKKFF